MATNWSKRPSAQTVDQVCLLNLAVLPVEWYPLAFDVSGVMQDVGEWDSPRLNTHPGNSSSQARKDRRRKRRRREVNNATVCGDHLDDDAGPGNTEEQSATTTEAASKDLHVSLAEKVKTAICYQAFER